MVEDLINFGIAMLQAFSCAMLFFSLLGLVQLAVRAAIVGPNILFDYLERKIP